jgi:hypothetical protein
MNADAVKASYARALTDRIIIRRYTGAGTTRPRFDVEDLRARVTGYAPHELVGSIQQGDRKVIVLADDLLGRGIALPLTKGDRCVIRGQECAIEAVDSNSRRVGATLIAYELQVRSP